MAAPDRFRFGRPDHPGAAQRRGRRRAIILKAIAIRLGYITRSSRPGGNEDCH
jgi:hypothetical protein